MLLNYVGPQTVHFAAGGEGGADELAPHFEEDQIQYPHNYHFICFNHCYV